MIGTLVVKGLTCKHWLGFQKVHKILEKDIEIKYKKQTKITKTTTTTIKKTVK